MAVRKRRTTTRRKVRKPTTKRKSTKTRTDRKVSFEITVPVRNVTPDQARKIKSDAKKTLTGAKFKSLNRRRKT